MFSSPDSKCLVTCSEQGEGLLLRNPTHSSIIKRPSLFIEGEKRHGTPSRKRQVSGSRFDINSSTSSSGDDMVSDLASSKVDDYTRKERSRWSRLHKVRTKGPASDTRPPFDSSGGRRLEKFLASHTPIGTDIEDVLAHSAGCNASNNSGSFKPSNTNKEGAVGDSDYSRFSTNELEQMLLAQMRARLMGDDGDHTQRSDTSNSAVSASDGLFSDIAAVIRETISNRREQKAKRIEKLMEWVRKHNSSFGPERTKPNPNMNQDANEGTGANRKQTKYEGDKSSTPRSSRTPPPGPTQLKRSLAKPPYPNPNHCEASTGFTESMLSAAKRRLCDKIQRYDLDNNICTKGKMTFICDPIATQNNANKLDSSPVSNRGQIASTEAMNNKEATPPPRTRANIAFDRYISELMEELNNPDDHKMKQIVLDIAKRDISGRRFSSLPASCVNTSQSVGHSDDSDGRADVPSPRSIYCAPLPTPFNRPSTGTSDVAHVTHYSLPLKRQVLAAEERTAEENHCSCGAFNKEPASEEGGIKVKKESKARHPSRPMEKASHLIIDFIQRNIDSVRCKPNDENKNGRKRASSLDSHPTIIPGVPESRDSRALLARLAMISAEQSHNNSSSRRNHLRAEGERRRAASAHPMEPAAMDRAIVGELSYADAHLRNQLGGVTAVRAVLQEEQRLGVSGGQRTGHSSDMRSTDAKTVRLVKAGYKDPYNNVTNYHFILPRCIAPVSLDKPAASIEESRLKDNGAMTSHSINATETRVKKKTNGGRGSIETSNDSQLTTNALYDYSSCIFTPGAAHKPGPHFTKKGLVDDIYHSLFSKSRRTYRTRDIDGNSKSSLPGGAVGKDMPRDGGKNGELLELAAIKLDDNADRLDIPKASVQF